jgi:N-acetyl-alpha-D-muramate 1-phosphate uridylyltransferase
MSWRPETAMVLAAGLGQRMRPLNNGLPKPLVRLKGRPLIDHVLDRLGEAGVARAVVNVHYCADQITAHVASRQCPAIAISDESDRLLDTGGGVGKALSSLGPAPFVIHNSDSVWIDQANSNLRRLFAAWDGARMDSLMLLAPVTTSVGYSGAGDFALDADGRIVRRPKEGRVPFVFTGVSIAHPRLFEGSPDGPFSLNLLWDRAIAAGRLFGVTLDGTWMHVGDPAALDEAERLLERATYA